MKNQERVLKELKELKTLISKLIGTEDLPSKMKFSKTALDNAKEEYKKLSIERGKWLESHEISDVIKDAPYSAGKFIREHFEFSNFFKRGSSYFYNKNDLKELSQELKSRNIDLDRYMQLKEDREKFNKYVESISAKEEGKKKPKFKLPDGLKDIPSSPPLMPPMESLEETIQKLKEEFKADKLSDYIDVYGENYAMMKQMYYFSNHLDGEIKKKAKKWIKDFNLANHTLNTIIEKNINDQIEKDSKKQKTHV